MRCSGRTRTPAVVLRHATHCCIRYQAAALYEETPSILPSYTHALRQMACFALALRLMWVLCWVQ